MDKDLLLVLNASEGTLQIVVGQVVEHSESLKLLAHQEWDCPKNGTEKLSPLIKEIFEKLDMPLSRIYRIASLTGAGSFTGIRLCLATSSALSRALEADQVAIDYLTALAYNAKGKPNTRIRVITHAKRNIVHCADFICNEMQSIEQIGKTSLISPEKAFSKNEYDVILGSAVYKYKDEFKNNIDEHAILERYTNALNPHILLSLGQEALKNKEDLTPEYVRSCDALDNLEDISKKLGNDSKTSFALFNKLSDEKKIHTIAD